MHGSATCTSADFMERMEFKYDAKAREAGCCIASAAGFDSVPADVGTLWTQRKFGPKGVPATVESYVTMHCKRRLRGALTQLHRWQGCWCRVRLRVMAKIGYSIRPRIGSETGLV